MEVMEVWKELKYFVVYEFLCSAENVGRITVFTNFSSCFRFMWRQLQYISPPACKQTYTCQDTVELIEKEKIDLLILRPLGLVLWSHHSDRNVKEDEDKTFCPIFAGIPTSTINFDTFSFDWNNIFLISDANYPCLCLWLSNGFNHPRLVPKNNMLWIINVISVSLMLRLVTVFP